MTSDKVKKAGRDVVSGGALLLAAFTLVQSYLERDTAKLQAAEAAATAQVNVQDEVDEDLAEMGRQLLVALTQLEEREKYVERLEQRVEELERRHRIRTDRGRDIDDIGSEGHAEVGPPPPRPPAPQAALEEFIKSKKARPKKKAERYEDAVQQIRKEAW